MKTETTKPLLMTATENKIHNLKILLEAYNTSDNKEEYLKLNELKIQDTAALITMKIGQESFDEIFGKMLSFNL